MGFEARAPSLSPFARACLSICHTPNSPCSRLSQRYADLADEGAFEEAVWLSTRSADVPDNTYYSIRQKYDLHSWPSRQLVCLDHVVSYVMNSQQLPDDTLALSHHRLQLAADLRAEERLLLESDEGLFTPGYEHLKKELQKQGCVRSNRKTFVKNPKVKVVRDAMRLYYPPGAGGCHWAAGLGLLTAVFLG